MRAIVLYFQLSSFFTISLPVRKGGGACFYTPTVSDRPTDGNALVYIESRLAATKNKKFSRQFLNFDQVQVYLDLPHIKGQLRLFLLLLVFEKYILWYLLHS